MASGYGLTGGPGRCFPFFQEMLACYVINGESEDPQQRAKCGPPLENYYECLDHRKEKAKVAYLQKLYRDRMAQQDEGFSRPTEGQLRGLGLIGHEEDTKAVLAKTDDMWARAKAAASKEQ